MQSKIIKTLIAKLVVAIIALSTVGWIILFGKNLASSFTPVVYLIICAVIIVSLYVFFNKRDLLKNKIIIVCLVIFIIIGVIGWISSISEITGCRPYRCNKDFICAKPTELGIKITTGECVSEFSENIDFFCVREDNTCIRKPSAT